jgi:hypothetical protein
MNRRFVRFFRGFSARLRGARSLNFPMKLGSRGTLLPSRLADFNPDEFQTELVALEGAIQTLRQHFDTICRIQQQQQALNQKLTNPALSGSELQSLHQQFDRLETELVSATLPWQTLAEPFWQAIRFGGLGLVIGWFLKGIVHG